MNAKYWMAWLCGLGLLAPSLAAQASESVPTEAAPAQPGAVVKASEPAATARSPLWQAVEAQRRPHEGAGAEAQRQLGAEQRLELREQVRRAASMWSTAAPPPAERSTP